MSNSINPTSLRLGNWIRHITCGDVQVTGIRSKKVKDGLLYQVSCKEQDWLIPGHCQGIVINPTIFYNQIKGYSTETKSIPLTKDIELFWHDYKAILSVDYEDPSYGQRSIEIVEFKYIHELQNYYFLHTGSELEITL